MDKILPVLNLTKTEYTETKKQKADLIIQHRIIVTILIETEIRTFRQHNHIIKDLGLLLLRKYLISSY
jgi:hypothetical protein